MPSVTLELTDRAGVAGRGSDTGGEFTGSAATGHPDGRQEATTVVKASPPAYDAREQTANSEFATSVGSFDGQLAAVPAGGGCGRLTFRLQA